MIQNEKNDQLDSFKEKIKTMNQLRKQMLTNSNYEQSLMTTVKHTPKNKSAIQYRDKHHNALLHKNKCLKQKEKKEDKYTPYLIIQIPTLIIKDKPLTTTRAKANSINRSNYKLSKDNDISLINPKYPLSNKSPGNKCITKPLLIQKNTKKKINTKLSKQINENDLYHCNLILNNYTCDHRQNKLLQGNINTSKMMKIDSLITKGKLKRNSITDKLIFQTLKPDENIENYYQSGDSRPGDKYTILKRQLGKQKLKIEKMINDIKQAQTITESQMNMEVFKLYFRKNRNAINITHSSINAKINYK